jgi:hypothetical protein
MADSTGEVEMKEDILVFLREARAALIIEQEEGRGTRDLAITLTHVDTAILWRQADLQKKTPPIDQEAK